MQPIQKKTTNRELAMYANYSQPYIKEAACESKLHWAMYRLGIQVGDLLQKQADELLSIRRSHAAENAAGVILPKVEGEYQYTKEGERAMYDECTAYWQKECGITPYYIQAKPKQALTLREIDVLEGFVISCEMATEMRKEIEDKLTADLPD